MKIQENISIQLMRRTHLLDRVIDNLLPNMYPCNYNSADHFVKGILDEIRWFLIDVEEFENVKKIDIENYILDYKYDELTDYFNERCIVLKNNNIQESIRRILREETEYVKDVRVKISDILKTNRDGQSLDDAIVNVQDGLKSYSEGPPFLLKIGDKYEVLDGFHRIAQKILDGKKYIISDVMIKESNMNLQESIRRILREETELPLRARRRIHVIDELLEFQVKSYYKPESICEYQSGEELLEVVKYAVIDHMYWDYFGNIDDTSKEWKIIFDYFENYINNKYGDELKKYYHINCGN